MLEGMASWARWAAEPVMPALRPVARVVQNACGYLDKSGWLAVAKAVPDALTYFNTAAQLAARMGWTEVEPFSAGNWPLLLVAAAGSLVLAVVTQQEFAAKLRRREGLVFSDEDVEAPGCRLEISTVLTALYKSGCKIGSLLIIGYELTGHNSVVTAVVVSALGLVVNVPVEYSLLAGQPLFKSVGDSLAARVFVVVASGTAAVLNSALYFVTVNGDPVHFGISRESLIGLAKEGNGFGITGAAVNTVAATSLIGTSSRTNYRQLQTRFFASDAAAESTALDWRGRRVEVKVGAAYKSVAVCFSTGALAVTVLESVGASKPVAQGAGCALAFMATPGNFYPQQALLDPRQPLGMALPLLRQ